MREQDLSIALQERVIEAAADGTPLQLRGGGSKVFLGREPRGEPRELAAHCGILEYEPRELVITARAGPPLAEIETALAQRGQMLPFEPPAYGPDATLGGTIAAGLSGPRRAYAGSARDYLLGCRIISGRGEILRFGGAVMKNVAGYDLSRLMCGAMGTLGVLLEVSLKVLPLPASELTLVQQRSQSEALEQLAELATTPLPLSASCWHDGRLYLRLSGAESAVAAAAAQIGGERLSRDTAFWREQIREQGHPAFQGELPLWRLSVPPGTPAESLPKCEMIEWGGALRWSRSRQPAQQIQQAAASAGGHATLFRGGDRSGQIYQPLSDALWALHRNIKRAFDPQGLFNPGRLYPEL